MSQKRMSQKRIVAEAHVAEAACRRISTLHTTGTNWCTADKVVKSFIGFASLLGKRNFLPFLVFAAAQFSVLDAGC